MVNAILSFLSDFKMLSRLARVGKPFRKTLLWERMLVATRWRSSPGSLPFFPPIGSEEGGLFNYFSECTPQSKLVSAALV